ncbi:MULTISPECIES: hypothetical protein [unclassified Acinetobacter]|uniref:hypothetical protein n=2 Tax=Acinetobacter TaxID=469 RepID=UPI0018AA8A24|nr:MULTISPECIES: hypothetical protein [unclassified Acinetobacter]
MGVGGASPTVGTSCATCLRKFTVHIRNDHTKFQGKYGFDWLRNEYVNSFYKVDGINFKPLFKGKSLSDLREIYTSGQQTAIAPFGFSYSPAWLAIFANTNNNQSPVGSSEININGVDLDLEVIPLEPDNHIPLIDDGTLIELISTNKYLEITPNKFSIKDLIGNRRDRILDMKNNTKQYYYENLKKINIKCKNGILEKHEEINIYASKNKKREKVGKLMVYRNNDIPKLDLYFIDVVTDDKKINKPNNYEYFLKFQSYNQALVRAEKKLETKFDLVSLAKSYPEIDLFIKEVNHPDIINKQKSLDAQYLADKVIDFFDKYGGKYRPNDGQKFLKINGDGHARTYVFYTNLIAGGVNGIAPPEISTTNNKWDWGNTVVVYKQAQMNSDTLVHEIGHSLRLPHTFESAGGNKIIFYQGFTGNIMDYTWYQANSLIPNTSNQKVTIVKSNIFKRVYFGKFQWDILRKDRSLK